MQNLQFTNSIHNKELTSKIGKELTQLNIKKQERGVPVMARWLTNPTRNHEVAGSIPALAKWVKNPVLPGAVV